jgi:hypothetical protein
MKKLSLVICFILFSSMSHAQFNIDITKTAGGSFDNAITANWSPPSSGATSEAFLTDTSLFQTLFLNNTIGNADIYKAGTANGTWADSSNAHTFSINVVGTPTAHGTKPGPRWRVIKSVANGTTFNGSWFDISSGANSISMTGGTSFNRMVGFQIAGVVNIDSFSHDYGSSTDSLTVSAVPEPSTYALIAGFAAFLFVAIKRRK